MFQYNQELAMKAGGAIRETGAYVGKLTSAIYGSSQQKGTKFIELTFESTDGTEFNYLTLYYQKADGSEIKGGASMINAIMGIANTTRLSQQLVQGTEYMIAPELLHKPIGLLLQKVLYSKQDGSEGYKFEIRLPFDPQTKQTLKERVENKSPEMVDRMAATLGDKDDRNQQGNVTKALSQPGGFGQPQGGFGQQNQAAADMGFDVPDNTFDN